MTKVLSHVILVLHYVKMVPSNVRKKKRKPPNMIKVQSYVMFVLQNVRIVSSNVREKNKRTTECDKITITYDVGTAQCEDSTIKCEKKIKQPSNVTKVQSHMMFVMHNTRMIPSNVRKKI